MSTGIHRAVEIGIGLALAGYCAYVIYAGRIPGKWRVYTRDEDPWSFWSGVLIMFGFALMFLFGFVSWRN